MESRQGDVCRVCRSEGTSDKPLYHPCVCTGSIKYIHQECLVQWLKYSKKEYCELCKHRYTFTPIYAPDMPKRLPIRDLLTGLLNGILRAVRYWLHYTLVAFAWLGIVPLTACRIYRCLFNGSLGAVLTLPLDLLSADNLLSDCFQGCFIVTCTLCTFISLVWLREQIMHGGGPDWLDVEQAAAADNDIRPNNNVQDNNANNAPDVGAEIQADVHAPADVGQEGVEHGEEEANNVHDENENNGQEQEEVNWNPMDWDRAAEDLTWERLLGLDGSLLFMEHVFWVVSLNTLFIMIFAFSPYHIGHFVILSLQLQQVLVVTQFEGLLTTLTGYITIAVSLSMLHHLLSFFHWAKAKRVLGLCYVAVKVSLLVVMEIGFFPLICGWWLDICSLSMFEATLKDRENSFRLAPGNSMFIHWLIGMVYIFYFASFILLLREVLRPGVLWFLRNLNDPDFNPIQEMIHLPMIRHARRFLASMVVFGTIVLVMLWLPVQVVHNLFPTFLPFYVVLSSDTPVSELSLELLLLQVVLPALLEQGHTRQWLKSLIKAWCMAAAWLLDLRSYLLGDVSLDEKASAEKDDGLNDVAEANDAPMEADDNAPVVNVGVEEAAGDLVVRSLNEATSIPVMNSSLDKEWATETEVLRCHILTSEPSDSVGIHIVADNNTSLMSNECSGVSGDVRVNHQLESSEIVCTISVKSLDMSQVLCTTMPESNLDVGNRQCRLKAFGEYDAHLHIDFNVTKNVERSTDVEVDTLVKHDWVPVGATGYEVPLIPVVTTNHEIPSMAFANKVDIVEAMLAANNELPEIPLGVLNPTTSNGMPVLLADEEINIDALPAGVDELPEIIENGEALPVEQPAVVDAVQPLAFIAVPAAQGLGDMHQAMMQAAGPIGFQPYKRPDFFALKLGCLLVMVCITLFLASLTSLLVPVYVGRQLMSVWTGETKVHELYTVACGLYACWVVLRMSVVLYTWIPQGWHVIFNKVMEWTILVSKSLFVAVILIGVVPLMLGIIFELVVVMPIRVPLEMTPIFFPWQDWALGVLHAKIITAATMMGPQWKLKRVIEQVYQQGLRNMNLRYIMVELCLPVLVCLGLILAVPHIIAKTFVPALGFDFETQNIVLRHIYPFILGVVLFVTFCIFQARQFWRLYEHIKNDKYLVGQRLVNYERH